MGLLLHDSLYEETTQAFSSLVSFKSMSSEAMDSPIGSLDSPVSDIHIVKIAKDFLRNWEELGPYLRLLPVHEYEIKKDGQYGDQKREALRMWKEQSGRKATYRALIVVANEVSNVELAENIEALVAPHPARKEERPIPAADPKMIKRYDGYAKAPEAHAPVHYRHNEGICLSLVCPTAELLQLEELMACGYTVFKALLSNSKALPFRCMLFTSTRFCSNRTMSSWYTVSVYYI